MGDLPHVLPVGLRVLDVRLARSGPAQSGRGDAPRPARRRGLRVVPRPGHRRRARGDSVAARRARRTLRLLAARAVHRGYEPPSDPSHLGPLPLRLPRRCRPVRAGFWRALRRLRPSGGGIRGTPGAGPHFFTPINEITFFGFMGGEWGWAAPFRNTRRTGTRFASPCAPPTSRPSRRFARSIPRPAWSTSIRSSSWYRPRIDRIWPTRRRTRRYEDTFYAWDVIAGQRHPELGGAPEILDIVGVNCYSFGQMEFREQGPHAALPPDDPRIKPLGELLTRVWERYRRPMIIGETSGLGEAARIGSGTSSRSRWPPCGRGSTCTASASSRPSTCPTGTLGSGCTMGSVTWSRRGATCAVSHVRTLRRRAAPLAARAEPRHRARRGPVQRPGEPGRHRRGSGAAAAGVGQGLVVAWVLTSPSSPVSPTFSWAWMMPMLDAPVKRLSPRSPLATRQPRIGRS